MTPPVREQGLRDRVAFLVLLALLSTAVGLAVLPRLATPELPAGKSLDVAQLELNNRLPEFHLRGADGPVTADDLRGHWTFVYFGYTNCPDACPVTLSILAHAQESLQAQGLEPPNILFVSLDPARDTPDVLRRYTAVFGSHIAGATGDTGELRELVRFFGVSYERKETSDGNNYTLDHTTNFFLVTPDVRWLATFSPAEDPDAVTEDTLTLLRMKLSR